MNTERAVEVVNAAHDQLATFASKSHRSDGRGVVLLNVPELPPGHITALGSTEMIYHTLDKVRRLTCELRGTDREEGYGLIRTIETYDPVRQAVVTVTVGRETPITVTMTLERPMGV
jgi:hypothetical protein